jgi:hypothetical protein
MRSTLAAASVTFILAACATAPRQTVELSEIVDQQIAQMQASHEKFVRLYYDGLRHDVDEFMTQRWTPQFLSNVIEAKGKGGKEFRAALDRGYALANVDWSKAVRIEGIDDPKTREAIQQAIDAVAVRERGELGQVLIDFSNEAQKQIGIQRRKLLDPIDAQEAFVLDELRQGYAQLLAGSASIKAYLASVVSVKESSDAVLKQVGLLDEQRRLIDTAIQVNEGAMTALAEAKGAQEGIEAAVERLKEWYATVKKATQ